MCWRCFRWGKGGGGLGFRGCGRGIRIDSGGGRVVDGFVGKHEAFGGRRAELGGQGEGKWKGGVFDLKSQNINNFPFFPKYQVRAPLGRAVNVNINAFFLNQKKTKSYYHLLEQTFLQTK